MSDNIVWKTVTLPDGTQEQQPFSKRTGKKLPPQNVNPPPGFVKQTGKKAGPNATAKKPSHKHGGRLEVYKDGEKLAGIAFQKAMQKMGGRARRRLNELVMSKDERIALDATKFVVERAFGKASQDINVNQNITYEFRAFLENLNQKTQTQLFQDRNPELQIEEAEIVPVQTEPDSSELEEINNDEDYQPPWIKSRRKS